MMKDAMNERERSAEDNRITAKKIIEIAKKTGFYILLGILAFMIAVTVWMSVDKFILGSPLPSFAGYSALNVSSGSMEDTVMENDLIVIRRADEFEIGDVITFIHDGEKIPTTHRIVGFGDSSEEFVTRGDANGSDDTERVTKEEILGTMVFHFKGSALVMGWLIDGGGLIFVILIALILLVGIYLLNRERGKKSEDEDTVN